MLPTLALTSILTKWQTALLANDALNTFCLSKYGRKPHIYIGLDLRNPPADDDETQYPYIVLFPGPKTEGLNQTEYTYTPSVGWVLIQEAVTTGDNTTTYDGIIEVDEMGQLILQAVAEANPDYPVTQVDFKATGLAFAPQYAGTADVTISIPITMGLELEY